MGLTIEGGYKFLKPSAYSNKEILLHIFASETIDMIQPIQEPMQVLLYAFYYVFSTSTELPPPRTHDHQIILKKPQPISVRPYRYPCFQKTKIEKIVHELLTSEVIKPS